MRSEDCGYRVHMLAENRLIISGGVLDRISYHIPSNSRMESSALLFDSFVLFVSFVVKHSAL